MSIVGFREHAITARVFDAFSMGAQGVNKRVHTTCMGDLWVGDGLYY